VSGLHGNHQGVDFSSKVKLVFGNKGVDDVQKMLEQQTAALALVLTACNWYGLPLPTPGPVGFTNLRPIQTMDEQKALATAIK
jgi:hypothetical protein